MAVKDGPLTQRRIWPAEAALWRASGPGYVKSRTPGVHISGGQLRMNVCR